MRSSASAQDRVRRVVVQARPTRANALTAGPVTADLEVAADVPVRALLPELAAALSAASAGAAGSAAIWQLHLVESQRGSGPDQARLASPRAIDLDATLADAGVVHGDGLRLTAVHQG